MSVAVFALGGALLAAALRWWRPALSWRLLAAYLLLAAAFFAVPPGSGALRLPTDVAYLWRPWSERAALGPEGPRNGLLRDPVLQMLPFHALVRERLLHGEAPLWAHELGTGQPLLGNAQSAPFAPLHLLALPLPPLAALPVAAAWQLFLALALTHALLQALGAGRLGAAFAALAYAFSTFSVAWSLYPLGMAAAWVPGVLLGLLLLRRGERGGLGGLTACATGLALSGQPEALAHAALAALAVAAVLAASRTAVPRRRFAAKLVLAAAIAACLAAPALLPVLAALPESARREAAQRNPDAVWPPPFAPATASLLIDPLAQGSPRDANWSGPLNYNELATGYPGLLALALAAAAALTLRGRPLAVLLGGAAALAVALRLPPLFHLLAAVPEIGHAAHGRLRLYWILAVAMAAGLGLDALPRRRAAALTAAACCAAAGLALLLLPPPSAPGQQAGSPFPAVIGQQGSSPPSPAVSEQQSSEWLPRAAPWQRAWWLAALCGAALAAVAFAVPRLRRAAPAVALLGLALDLALLEARYVPLVPAPFDLAPPAAAAWLAAATHDPGGPWRTLADGEDLAPNLGALYGLWDPRGNDPMQPAAAARIVGGAFQPHYLAGRRILLSRRRLPQPLLDYLGVRYLLLRHLPVVGDPWQPVWEGEGGRIWRNPQALPLFFFPARVRQVPDAAAANAFALANPDFAADGVVEAALGAPAAPRTATGAPAILPRAAPPPPQTSKPSPDAATKPAIPNTPEASLSTSPAERGAVAVRRIGANGFILDAASPTAGTVVSSISYAAGWRLTVDDHDAPVLRANGGFLGFSLPPGRHRLQLTYRPRAWLWGCALWCLGAALIAIASRRTRRQTASHVHCRLE
jgi:hypothetical protein